MISGQMVALLLQRCLQSVIHAWAKLPDLMSSSHCLTVAFFYRLNVTMTRASSQWCSGYEVMAWTMMVSSAKLDCLGSLQSVSQRCSDRASSFFQPWLPRVCTPMLRDSGLHMFWQPQSFFQVPSLNQNLVLPCHRQVARTHSSSGPLGQGLARSQVLACGLPFF